MNTTSSPCLQTVRLEVSIGGTLVCRELNLQLHAGRVFAILGRNGVGKSTLLATLAGLSSPAGGEIMLNGQPLNIYSPRELARQRGWMAQKSTDSFGSTVLQTALIGRHPYLKRWDWESSTDIARARAALNDVGLESLEDRLVATLSGGEQQRLAFATVLTQAPMLYLLDEPLAHLDLKYQTQLLQHCVRLARQDNACLLLVLHQPGFALRYCDAALLLYGQGSYEFGPTNDLLTSERLSGLYEHRLNRVGEGGSAWFAPA